MSSLFNNDELPPANSSMMHAGTKVVRNGERVWLVAHNNGKAPLEENRQQVLVELVDTSSAAEHSGLDLVAVVDVSGSMRDKKLDKLKTAMKFFISKLGSTDRLSIVSFSTAARRLCPLQPMAGASK